MQLILITDSLGTNNETRLRSDTHGKHRPSPEAIHPEQFVLRPGPRAGTGDAHGLVYGSGVYSARPRHERLGGIVCKSPQRKDKTGRIPLGGVPDMAKTCHQSPE